MTKRQFLESVSAVGGVSAMLTALNGWDMGIASAAESPPDLRGNGNIVWKRTNTNFRWLLGHKKLPISYGKTA